MIMLVKISLLLVITVVVLGQIPIPKRQVGFVYNGGSANAPVELDAYFGPLCPDSQTAFPTLLQVANTYGAKTLRLKIHLFPLPYHRNSFLVAMIPIPKRPVGFSYIDADASAPVQLDAYMGPLCPYSQLAFPTLLQVAYFYGPYNLRLRVHLFPLPYHRNSFLVAMGQHIVDQVTHQNMTYAWMSTIYKNANMAALSNTGSATMSENSVKSLLSKIGAQVGVSESVFMQMIEDVNINMDTRIGWKYTCSRGVSGTPTFMLNDVLVAATPSWTVNDWKQVIDPLLGRVDNSINQGHHTQTSQRSNTTCKIGTRKCEYLPQKVECCTHGEACIPNVGCRC